jgi:hypothetical protein
MQWQQRRSSPSKQPSDGNQPQVDQLQLVQDAIKNA